MNTAEEKAAAYLSAYLAAHPELALMEDGWSDAALKKAFAAGYQDAEKYRLLLQASIRNATPTTP